MDLPHSNTDLVIGITTIKNPTGLLHGCYNLNSQSHGTEEGVMFYVHHIKMEFWQFAVPNTMCGVMKECSVSGPVPGIRGT